MLDEETAGADEAIGETLHRRALVAAGGVVYLAVESVLRVKDLDVHQVLRRRHVLADLDGLEPEFPES